VLVKIRVYWRSTRSKYSVCQEIIVCVGDSYEYPRGGKIHCEECIRVE